MLMKKLEMKLCPYKKIIHLNLNTKTLDKLRELSEDYGLSIEGHSQSIRCLAITNDNKYLISGSDDTTLRVWKIPEMYQITVLPGHKSRITCIAITIDCKYLVSGSNDNTIRIWNLDTYNQTSLITIENAYSSCITISKDAKLIISGLRTNINIWDFFSNALEAELECNSQVTVVEVTNNNEYIVSGSFDNNIRIWNLKHKTQEFIYNGHESFIMSLILSNDDQYVISRSHDKIIIIWRLYDQQQVTAINCGYGDYGNLFITNDSNYIILYGKNNTIMTWDINKAIQVDELQLNYHNTCFALCKNNEYLYTCSDKGYLIQWNFKEKIKIASAHGHRDKVLALEFSSDKCFAVSGGRDHTIRVWNIKEKHQQHIFKNIANVISIAITKNNKYIISNSYQDMNFKVWRII